MICLEESLIGGLVLLSAPCFSCHHVQGELDVAERYLTRSLSLVDTSAGDDRKANEASAWTTLMEFLWDKRSDARAGDADVRIECVDLSKILHSAIAREHATSAVDPCWSKYSLKL